MSSPEVAFITGAGTGIGRAAAVRLAQRGASVGLLSRSRDNLEETAALVREAGGTALVVPGDVSKEDDVRAAVQQTVAELGPLRTTVASAGVEILGVMPTISVEDWNTCIAVNLTGVFYTARHAIPAMVEAGGGTFVAVASDSGVEATSGWGAYCAAKHGVVGLVRALALDHGPQGVRSNVVAPGFVQTPMADRLTAGIPAEDLEEWKQTVPLGRFSQPTEIAAAIAHLTCDESSYVNGQVYNIDGGTTAGQFVPGMVE